VSKIAQLQLGGGRVGGAQEERTVFWAVKKAKGEKKKEKKERDVGGARSQELDKRGRVPRVVLISLPK